MKSDQSTRTIREVAKQLHLEGVAGEDMLVRALQECQAMIDAKREVDYEALLNKYPGIREELSACFESLKLMSDFEEGDLTTPDGQPRLVESDRLAPSATLGDFRLLRELGRGGMGVVYEAEQLSVGRRVALKVLPFAAMLDKRQVARFQNEARAAATLEHPHIVPVYFVGTDRGVYYYAMRLIEGKNLSEVLGELREKPENTSSAASMSFGLAKQISRRSHATSQDESNDAKSTVSNVKSQSITLSNTNASQRIYFDSIAKIAKQAAMALDFAHTHGIVHRDVKPANIMLDELGDAWVTDFGLARIETGGDVTMTGDLVGTLRYMSPEQTLAKRTVVDHRSDVYSLGATLYELIALKPAFEGGDRAELLKKIAMEEPKPPSRSDSRVPQDLETIALKAMEKKPQDRYGSAQEMASDLERFLNRQPILARRTSLARRFNMWRTRHPLAVSTIALGIAVLAMLTIGAPFLWMQRAAREQAERLVSQAQRLADATAARAATQEYFASVSEVRELNVRRPVGWTWDALEQIKNVAQLDADGKDLLQLRSLATNALIASDVQLIQEFAQGIDPGAVASSHDGKYLAIGEVRPSPDANVARIYIYEVADTVDRVALVRTLELPGRGGMLGAIVQRVRGGPEGVRSLCFSNHDHRLAVGTRYGQILQWDLDSDEAPVEIVKAKSDENERVVRLEYSPDDQYFVACIGGSNVLRIIDPASRQNAAWEHPKRRESFVFDEGGKLLFQNARGILMEIEDLANPIPRQREMENPVRQVNGLAADRFGTCGVVGDWSPLGPTVDFMDLPSLTSSMRIDVAPSTAESAYSLLEFGPADQSVIGLKGGNQFRVWDGLSGSKLFDLPKSATVYAKHAIASSTNLWAISGSPGSELYRWRNPSRITDVTSRQGETSPVMKTFAPGAWPIRAFDLSQDGERIALIESHTGNENQVRVRSFALSNGQEDGRWTLNGDAIGRERMRTRGTDVLYSHGGSIVAACKEVGIPMVLGRNGIQIPADTARPIVTAQGRADDNGTVSFEFSQPPTVVKPYEQLALGFSVRFVSGEIGKSIAEGHVMHMDVSMNGKPAITRQLSVEPYLAMGADGWHSQLVVRLEKTTGPIRLDVSLRNSNANESPTLKTGSAYLMATLGEHAAHYWLGPYATQGNGKIVAAEDGNTITSRDTPLGVPNWKWTDTLNEFATIRAIAAAENASVFGTRWGHVYWVDAQRTVRPLNSVGRSHGGDVQEEVASVAIDRMGKRAASGSLDGNVTLFDLNSPTPNREEVRIPAHSEAISCVALHRDGKTLATASANATLKVWRETDQGWELWFETSFRNPIADMQFSPANEQLFFLCRRERGIRVLDLDALHQEFESLKISDSPSRAD